MIVMEGIARAERCGEPQARYRAQFFFKVKNLSYKWKHVGKYKGIFFYFFKFKLFEGIFFLNGEFLPLFCEVTKNYPRLGPANTLKSISHWLTFKWMICFLLQMLRFVQVITYTSHVPKYPIINLLFTHQRAGHQCPSVSWWQES